MLSNENIYSWVAPPPRSSSPVRIFINKKRVERFQKCIEKLQSEHKTMGLPEIESPHPQNFLKRKDRDNRPQLVTLDESERARLCEKTGQERRPPVPDHFFHDPLKSPRDFCTKNVNYAMSLIPPVQKERVVIGARGTVVDLENTVLRPKYLGKPTYGKLPLSVIKFQAKANREAKMAQDMKQFNDQQKTQQILENKNSLHSRLMAAKDKWDEKNKEFLLLPVITDTLTSKKKRYLLERDLAALEDEINSLHSRCLNADKAWELHLVQQENQTG